MKIVLPVHHFPPHYSAGAELYTFRLARWLISQGHAVEVVCIEAIDQGSVGEIAASRDVYQGVPVWRLSYNIMDAPERRRWDFSNPLLGRWFANYFASEQPDVAHFQAGYLLGSAPLEAALAAGVPTVLTLHDYWFLCPRITLLRGDGTLCDVIPENPTGCVWCNRLEQRRYRLAETISLGLVGQAAQPLLRQEAEVLAERRATLLPALALPNKVIAPSRFLAQQYAPYVPPERIHLLRYGIDLEPFRERTRTTSTALRIGYLGQIAPHKGVHILVDAFRRLQGDSSIELHIYGGLDAHPPYVRQVRQRAGNDQRIQFHGRFAHADAPGILSGLDVVVVPSVWYENSPLAIMEAHAAGVPVITSALGGMAELVRHGIDGVLFRSGDADDLTTHLQQIVDEPDVLPKLRAGIHLPQSIDDESNELLAIYAQARAVESAAFAIA